MALLEEQFTETLDAGAPDITYQGNEGKEQQIARSLWDQLPNEIRMQFGSFQQFFSSGAWKEVLARLQQAQEQTPERIQETETIEEQPQQGLASMMPAQMAYGGVAGPDGRKAYGLGSFFKKITKPIKKLVKSPVGKAAAMYGIGTMLGGMPAFTGGTKFAPSWTSALNLFKPGQWSQGNLLNPLLRKSKDIVKAGKTIKEYGDPSWAKVLGAGATLAPFAMAGAGKWDTGEQDLSKFAEGAWDFDYSGMRKELADAALTGNQDKVDLVLAKYGLSAGDMPGQAYWKTAAQGGRIGYAEGGWEAREKQNLISKLVNMGLPLPQAMKMAEMIIANATPEELQSALAGTRQQGLTPEESIKFQETIETPTEDISLTDQVSQYVPDIPQYKPVRRNVNQAMMGRMQRPEIGEMVMEKFRTPRGMEESVEEIRESLPEGMNEGGLMSLGGMEMDLRGGGFVPIGAKEKADDVPARLSKNEFVFTADAVRAAGNGDVDAGADKMYKTMKQLENRVG